MAHPQLPVKWLCCPWLVPSAGSLCRKTAFSGHAMWPAVDRTRFSRGWRSPVSLLHGAGSSELLGPFCNHQRPALLLFCLQHRLLPHGLRWLLDLQTSYLHRSQSVGGRVHCFLQYYFLNCTRRLLLHTISQRDVVEPRVIVRGWEV